MESKFVGLTEADLQAVSGAIRLIRLGPHGEEQQAHAAETADRGLLLLSVCCPVYVHESFISGTLPLCYPSDKFVLAEPIYRLRFYIDTVINVHY